LPVINPKSTLLYRASAVLKTLWSLALVVLIGVVLVVLLYWVGGREFYLWVNAKQWVETECTIQNAAVLSQTSHSEDGGTSEQYRVDVNYWFMDETDIIYGDRYDFGGTGYSSGYGDKSRIVKLLKRNPTVRCFYSARNPDLSVIDRSFDLFMLVSFIPLVLLILLLLSVFSWFQGLFKKRRHKKSA